MLLKHLCLYPILPNRIIESISLLTSTVDMPPLTSTSPACDYDALGNKFGGRHGLTDRGSCTHAVLESCHKIWCFHLSMRSSHLVLGLGITSQRRRANEIVEPQVLALQDDTMRRQRRWQRCPIFLVNLKKSPLPRGPLRGWNLRYQTIAL